MKPVNSGISLVGEGGASDAVGLSIVGDNEGAEPNAFDGDRNAAASSKLLACAGLSGEIDRARSESWLLVSRAPTSSGSQDLQSLTFSKCPPPSNVFFQGLNAFHVLLFSALLEFGDGSEERCSFVGHCLQVELHQPPGIQLVARCRPGDRTSGANYDTQDKYIIQTCTMHDDILCKQKETVMSLPSTLPVGYLDRGDSGMHRRSSICGRQRCHWPHRSSHL